jgi:nitrite reductase/ring-hydroxylating ferredoxin subunit
MDAPNKEFAFAGSLEELKAKGRLVVHGRHRPILVIYDRGRIVALDNRCPHMGFPLERGSLNDGILTCHWHHARFDLESGCTFDLWADDVPICPIEIRDGDVWVKTTFGHTDPVAHWRERLADGLAHDLGLVVAKAVHGQLAADVPRADIARQVARSHRCSRQSLPAHGLPARARQPRRWNLDLSLAPRPLRCNRADQR